jgi:hypothetical protein
VAGVVSDDEQAPDDQAREDAACRLEHQGIEQRRARDERRLQQQVQAQQPQGAWGAAPRERPQPFAQDLAMRQCGVGRQGLGLGWREVIDRRTEHGKGSGL